MRNVRGFICIALLCSANTQAQRRALDWSFYGGDAQRTNWEKSDSSITTENVKDFQLVLKRKLDNGPTGSRTLTPPVVLGTLISYKGFKELAFVTGSSGTVWSIDVDTDRLFWTKRLEAKPVPSAGCPATVTAVPSLTPPLNFAARRTPRAPAATPPKPGILGTGAFGALRPAFALSGDGKLHFLNTSNGDDLVPAIPFTPPHSVASSLAISDGVIYTTTDSRCSGAPAGVWALDLSSVDPKNTTGPAPQPASFRTSGGNISSVGGLAFGANGTVYVQTGEGPLDPDANKWAHTLLALTPKDLKVEKYFTSPASKADANLATPVVFTYKDREFIVTAGGDGALYLLDTQTLGGENHKTALYRTPALTTAGQGVWGGLSSWQDPTGTRWILASVWGSINPELKLNATPASHGAIVAFKVEDQSGVPVLTPAWASRDMSSPEPPVIASGIVFALAAQPHATLYAFDALTGKELYSTGSQVTTPANLTGIAIANGRVYFTTNDNTLYAFGIALER